MQNDMAKQKRKGNMEAHQVEVKQMELDRAFPKHTVYVSIEGNAADECAVKVRLVPKNDPTGKDIQQVYTLHKFLTQPTPNTVMELLALLRA